MIATSNSGNFKISHTSRQLATLPTNHTDGMVINFYDDYWNEEKVKK